MPGDGPVAPCSPARRSPSPAQLFTLYGSPGMVGSVSGRCSLQRRLGSITYNAGRLLSTVDATRREPSGDQAEYAELPVELSVTCWRSLPSGRIFQISSRPDRFE